ncbi:MAG: threonine/serine dehydratase [Deltaproteobacteria bacterium]|nr:threonine/serine dehydratase [Deltaproteobacteria bacterium]
MSEPERQDLPTYPDVEAAAAFIAGRVVRTPTLRSPVLDALAGAELWLKAENLQRIGAFKARGALTAVGRLSPAERARGVLTYSSGNHAQAVALAAKEYGVPCHVTMPTDTPAIKLESVRALGAEVTFAGTTSADRKAAALEIAERSGAVIIPPFDDPNIIAGQGTATLELFQDVAAQTDGGSLDALVVPVGGGGLLAGACLVAAHHSCPVYVAEPVGCDAMGQSLEQGERARVEPGPTIADGLKPVRVGALNFAIARRHVRAAFRVTDQEIGPALVSLLVYAKVMVEPSGAAALAVALRGPSARAKPGGGLPGNPKRVGVLLSGGNLGSDDLAELLAQYPPLRRRSA